MAGDPRGRSESAEHQAQSRQTPPPDPLADGWSPERHAPGRLNGQHGWQDDLALRREDSAPPSNANSNDERTPALPPAAPSPPMPTSAGVEAGPPQVAGSEGGEPPAPATAEAAQPARSSTRIIVREIVETGLLALLVFLAVRASFQNFKVDGESMMPTLHNGEFMIVNKLVYAQVNAGALSRFIPFIQASANQKENVFHGPQRGDIVVLVNPRDPSIDLVKRVIGLPGDTLEIIDGHVYINDHLLIEPYVKVAWHYTGPKITIPQGQYFVMGDNRANSLDSRSPQVGLIPRDMIIGKAMLSYWPLSQFGLAPNASPKLSPTQTTPRVASTLEAAGGS